MRGRRTVPKTGAPFLRHVATAPEKVDPTAFPFTIRAFQHGLDLPLRTAVTFFVGENGSGKSTLLEALAECCGYPPEGGNRDHQRASFVERSAFAQALRLTWQPKVVEYRETRHYLVTRDFLNAPERFFKHLFDQASET